MKGEGERKVIEVERERKSSGRSWCTELKDKEVKPSGFVFPQ